MELYAGYAVNETSFSYYRLYTPMIAKLTFCFIQSCRSLPLSAQEPALVRSFELAQHANMAANSAAHGEAMISFFGRTLSLSILIAALVRFAELDAGGLFPALMNCSYRAANAMTTREEKELESQDKKESPLMYKKETRDTSSQPPTTKIAKRQGRGNGTASSGLLLFVVIRCRLLFLSHRCEDVAIRR